MMERKICTLFPSLGRTMPGTLLGCMAHVYRRKKKERERENRPLSSPTFPGTRRPCLLGILGGRQ